MSRKLRGWTIFALWLLIFGLGSAAGWSHGSTEQENKIKRLQHRIDELEYVRDAADAVRAAHVASGRCGTSLGSPACPICETLRAIDVVGVERTQDDR
jgi:hypothetical protein